MSDRSRQQEHKSFLISVRDWIRQHNENPDKVKLRSKDELMEAKKSLTVKKDTGSRFELPKKQFVCSSAWDENIHGKWDPSKEVEQEIRGSLGLPGSVSGWVSDELSLSIYHKKKPAGSSQKHQQDIVHNL